MIMCKKINFYFVYMWKRDGFFFLNKDIIIIKYYIYENFEKV